MLEPKAVLFDFFGVICVNQLQAWLAKSKLSLSGSYHKLSQRSDLGKIDMGDFFEGLSTLSGQPVELVKMSFERNTKLDQALLHLILTLKKNYKVGVISNSSSEWIRGILNEFHLSRLFDVIIVSGEVGYIKPQLEIFQIALDKLDVKAEETVFVDDTPVNVKEAGRLGMIGLVYSNLQNLKADLKKTGVKW